MQRQKHSPQRTQRNPELSVGDIVNYHAFVGGPISSTGHTIKSISKIPNSFGCDVAYISNKSGCIDLDALSLFIDLPLRNSASSAVNAL